MAVFPNSLLRDLFQNNVDYVSKQVSRILDYIYGEQTTANDTLPSNAFVFSSEQYYGATGSQIYSGFGSTRYYGRYFVEVNSVDGIIIKGNGQVLPYTYNSSWTPADISLLDNTIMPYMANYSLSLSMEELDIDAFRITNIDSTIRTYKNGVEKDLIFSKPFGVNNETSVSFRSLHLNTFNPQESHYITGTNEAEFYVTPTYDSGNFPDSYFPLSCIHEDAPSRPLVIMPSSDSSNVYNYIDDSTTYEVNIGGDTVYNYYNDYGDVLINGGAVGVAPVVGLNYNDIKFVLDSLIDELNLQFDFQEPLEYAPDWEEVHYIDQGSFYITPVKQIDNLPLAPDVGDTVPDISDYLSVVGGAVTSLYNMIDGLGVSLMLVFTFLICLIINHLKKE